MAAEPRPAGRTWLIAALAGGMAVLCLCALIAAVGLAIGGSVLAFMLSVEAEFDAHVEAPAQVGVNEEFAILVTVSNPTDREMLLSSIDLSEGYLEGISLVRTEPPYRDSWVVLGFTSYEFDSPIPAGGSLEIELQALALHPGDHRGELDVCVDAGFECATFQLRTVVSGGDLNTLTK